MSLLYKVVELSTVDEGSIERTVNEWVRQGWNLDGVQFAMRESSKRPAMAFVFFTRADGIGLPGETAETSDAPRSDDDAQRHLARLAEAKPLGPPARPVSAYERLIQLAESDDE